MAPFKRAMVVSYRLSIVTVTNRQSDGQTTCDRKTTLCTLMHRAVKINLTM